ncbi:MAG: hypothetical protein KJ721_02865 [Nanoarchaeota archaeon]|nr:hypothetical protein [Nanoarchaeota archaeon]
MKKPSKMKKVVLSKKVGWIILTILVFLDAFLDVKRGVEGNPVWQPIVNIIGINYVPFLVPFVLLLFYFVVKGGAWLSRKVDKIPTKSEELVLTALVLAYFVFDLWVISVDFFDFRLIKSHYYLTPVLVIVVLIYSLWAEYYLKKQK